MLPEWGKQFMCKLICNEISITEIAQKAGYTRAYVSALIHGKREGKDAKNKLDKIVDDIGKKKKGVCS